MEKTQRIKTTRIERPATYGEAFLAIIFMLAAVTGGFIFFGLKVELLMLISAAFAALIAYRIGIGWGELEKSIVSKLSTSLPAVLIIWSIGIVIGTYVFCGSIPMIIYYGLVMVDPQYMYAFSFLTCLILSVVTGTSWGSAGTAGVALMGVAVGLDVSLPITAGAVISGAVFGDKMSPLSDTTNLSPLCAGADLYDHIRSMMWTTVPAALISLILYFILGMGIDVNSSGLPEGAQDMVSQLSELYKWNWVLLIPFFIIIAGAVVKKPPVPTMIISAFIAIIIGIAYQGFDLTAGFTSAIDGFKVGMLTDNEVLPSIATLLNRGGMKSMVGIIVMLFAGYSYAGIIARGKFLEIVLEPFMKKINTEPKLVLSTLITSFLVLCCAGITYVAFILTADMYKKAYYNLNLQPRVLSRVMEDAATCMAPLVPWGTSGLFYVSVLGVSVYGAAGYAPYAFLTFLSPIVSFLISIFGIGMFKMSDEQRKAVGERLGVIDSRETLIAERQ